MNCDLYPSEDETYAFVWHIIHTKYIELDLVNISYCEI